MKRQEYLKEKGAKNKMSKPPVKGANVYVFAHYELDEFLTDFAKQEAIEFAYYIRQEWIHFFADGKKSIDDIYQEYLYQKFKEDET